MQTALALLDQHKWLGWLGFFILIFSISVLTAFHPVYPNILFNIVFPLIIVFIRKLDVFGIAKLCTLLISRVLIVFTVYGYIEGPVFVVLIIALLVVNILEAFLVDVMNKRWAGAISSFALAAAVPHMRGIWVDNTYVFITTTVYIFFVLAYAFWHINFMFQKYGQSIGFYHIIVQVVPLAFMLFFWEAGYWLMLRGTSLIFGAALHVLWEEQIKSYFLNEKFVQSCVFLQTEAVQWILAATNVILVACFLFFGTNS